MKVKHQILFKAVSSVLIALIAVILLFSGEATDTFGIVCAIALGVFFAFRAYRSFIALKEAGDEVVTYGPPADAPAEEKIKYIKNALLLLLLALTALTIDIVIDLNNLRSGAAEHVSLVAPAAVAYKHFGYWPAVLLFPVFGVLFSILMIWRFSKLKKEEEQSGE